MLPIWREQLNSSVKRSLCKELTQLFRFWHPKEVAEANEQPWAWCLTSRDTLKYLVSFMLSTRLLCIILQRHTIFSLHSLRCFPARVTLCDLDVHPSLVLAGVTFASCCLSPSSRKLCMHLTFSYCYTCISVSFWQTKQGCRSLSEIHFGTQWKKGKIPSSSEVQRDNFSSK